MPKKRNPENKGFPTGWRLYHGAIWYRVPVGLEALWDGQTQFRLGATPAEAYKVWADRVGRQVESKNIGQLLDQYAQRVIPTKAPKSQTADKFNIQRLRAVFGEGRLDDIKPQHIYKYMENAKAKVSAKRQIALLSHAFTKAVEWGYIAKHPFKGEVRLAGEKPRTRYVEDWEIIECLSIEPFRKAGSVLAIHAFIRLKLLTGLRRGDLLRLKGSDFGEQGLRVETHKTGKAIIYDWSPALETAVEMAKAARPVDISPYLFCNKFGKCYLDEATGEAHGWASMWQRFFDRVLEETKVTERFTEHDLRAKVGSDAESLEHARQLLTHADSRITQRVYRRKPERVKPAK